MDKQFTSAEVREEAIPVGRLHIPETWALKDKRYYRDTVQGLKLPPGDYALYLQPATEQSERTVPVAIVDADDNHMWGEIQPDVTVRVGQPLYAHPASAAQMVPEGCQLVLSEPNEKMCRAGYAVMCDVREGPFNGAPSLGHAGKVYRAMLAAAPQLLVQSCNGQACEHCEPEHGCKPPAQPQEQAEADRRDATAAEFSIWFDGSYPSARPYVREYAYEAWMACAALAAQKEV